MSAFAGGSSGVALPSEAFSSQIRLDHSATQTVPAATGTFTPRLLAGVTRVDGATLRYIIPAGNTTGINAASLAALHIVQVDAPNAGVDQEFIVTWNGPLARAEGTLKSLGLADATTPTLVSVNAVVDPANTLVLSFSKAVFLPDVSALSLLFSVGTARTITGILSGNGTSQVTVSLSGVITPFNDVLGLVVASSNIVDMLGNLVPNGTTSVHVPSTLLDLANVVLYWHAAASEVTPPGITNGAAITAAIDRSVPASPYLPGAHAPTWIADSGSGTPALSIRNPSGGNEQYLKIANSPIDDTVNCCVVTLFNPHAERVARNGIWTIDAADSTGAELFTIGGELDLNSSSTAGPVASPMSYDVYHLSIAYRSGTSWTNVFDGTAHTVDMTTHQPTSIKSFYTGLFAFNDAVLEGANVDLKVQFGMQHAPSATELTFIRNAVHALFPADTP